MKSLLLLATFLQVCLLVWATATVQFKFVSYSNSNHNEFDGGCCDDIIGGCDDFCDNYFIVCLDKDSTGRFGSSCDIADVHTARIYGNNDNFNFPSTIPNNVANPLTRTVQSWSGGMEVFVRVWDYDPHNNDDEIDRDWLTINQAAARGLSSASWQEYTIGTQTTFRFQVRVYCNSNYYSSDCSVRCVPMDNQNGHYSCDSITGAKICYSGWEGPNCNLDYNECHSNPCVNGACINGANRYSCSCANGWTGTNCNINVDDCASTPCKNGGICHDHVASFSCSCLPGHVYADHFCEYDDCAGQPCHNGATCLDLVSRFECICPLGYYGDLCEVDIDYCINQTCANNGTCVDRLDGFHCLCETGYEGFMCDVETDECASDPCRNNATCHDLIGQYRCTCKKGYEGTQCDIETDECLSFPCRNNATCEDEVAGYLCHCAAGFEGETCEIDKDECASSPCYANETCVDHVNGYWCLRLNLCDYDPCLNNATCLDDYPGFICECAAGYGGKTCVEDIDECISSPCLQGTCIDHLDGFSCLCPPGYAGVTCHSETDECNSSSCLNGTCWYQINGYVCNCIAGYTGLLCETDIDECADVSCDRGKCVDGINSYKCECNCDHGTCGSNSYKCTCDSGFFGAECGIDIDIYGAVITVTGKLDESGRLDLESNLASLLSQVFTPRTDNSQTVYVKIVLTEDYVKSTDGKRLTRVTFLAWTASHYLTKDTIEGLIGDASPELLGELGTEIYTGPAKPFTGNRPHNGTWIGSNWYVILLVVAVVVGVVAVGFIVWRKLRNKNAFKEYPRERGLPNHEPPCTAYSTRIADGFPGTRLDRINMVESLNPAYIPSCTDQHELVACPDDVVCGTEGALAGVRASNHYAEIPVLKAEAVANENPYSEIDAPVKTNDP